MCLIPTCVTTFYSWIYKRDYLVIKRLLLHESAGPSFIVCGTVLIVWLLTCLFLIIFTYFLNIFLIKGQSGAGLLKQDLQTDAFPLFLSGVSAVEAEWVPQFLPQYCHFGSPLESPSPWFCSSTGTIRCHRSSTFCEFSTAEH